MNKITIGSKLKELRESNSISVNEVSDLLIQNGYKASPKTIYGWENEHSQPNCDVLLYLCKLYNVVDILATFGYESNRNTISPYELERIQKYRALDEHGKEVVDTNLNLEYKRIKLLHFDRDSVDKPDTNTTTIEVAAMGRGVQTQTTKLSEEEIAKLIDKFKE